MYVISYISQIERCELALQVYTHFRDGARTEELSPLEPVSHIGVSPDNTADSDNTVEERT